MTSDELYAARKVCEAAEQLRRVWEAGNEPSTEECMIALGAVLVTSDELRKFVEAATAIGN